MSFSIVSVRLSSSDFLGSGFFASVGVFLIDFLAIYYITQNIYYSIKKGVTLSDNAQFMTDLLYIRQSIQPKRDCREPYDPLQENHNNQSYPDEEYIGHQRLD
jgi:hypothetical protein